MPPRLGLRPASFIPAQFPPVAVANGPYACLVGGTVRLDRGGSGDRYGTYQCYWTPGDGRAELGPYQGTAGDISLAYDTVGTYWASLRIVSDTTGLQALALAVVSVTAIGAVDQVVLDPAIVGDIVGAVIPVSAVPQDVNGRPLLGRVITWSTDTPTRVGLSATVGAGILLTLLTVGEATVTATCEGVGSVLPIVVTGTVAVGSVIVTPGSITGLAGDVVTLTARVYAAGG